MEYRVEFTMFLDTDEEHSELEISDMIGDHLDSAGASLSDIKVTVIKEADE